MPRGRTGSTYQVLQEVTAGDVGALWLHVGLRRTGTLGCQGLGACSVVGCQLPPLWNEMLVILVCAGAAGGRGGESGHAGEHGCQGRARPPASQSLGAVVQQGAGRGRWAGSSGLLGACSLARETRAGAHRALVMATPSWGVGDDSCAQAPPPHPLPGSQGMWLCACPSWSLWLPSACPATRPTTAPGPPSCLDWGPRAGWCSELCSALSPPYPGGWGHGA